MSDEKPEKPVQVIRMARSGGELTDRRDIATFEAWGHAVTAPTDTEPAKRLGLPPFTP